MACLGLSERVNIVLADSHSYKQTIGIFIFNMLHKMCLFDLLYDYIISLVLCRVYFSLVLTQCSYE